MVSREQGTPTVDRQSFDRLMLEHLPAAGRFAVRLVGDPASAEDVLHDALVRAASAWSGFRGASSFKTWLFQIVVNVFRDRLRATHAREAEPLPGDLEDPQHASDPLVVAAEHEVGHAVARAVSMLPPRQREVLVLVAYEQLSPGEAAAVLGITQENARASLHFARQRLKRQLKHLLDEPNCEPRT
jgi:RNA polymerase sigma-70 factor (ECF subfamily)